MSEYNHPLTEEFEDRNELNEVIAQIEQYEGKGKGYEVKSKVETVKKPFKGKWVHRERTVYWVCTSGKTMIVKPKDEFSYADVRSYKAD